MDTTIPKLLPTGERMMPEMTDVNLIIEHLHRYALATRYCKNKIVLDIACGEGYGSHILSQHAAIVTGVDIDGQAIKHAKAKYPGENLCFMQGSTDQIPLEDATVDVVVSFETIEHHDRHNEMMREIKRVLKTDGLLIISTPDKKYSDNTTYKNPFHVKELYADEFKGLLQKYFSHVLLLGQQTGTLSVMFPLDGGIVDKTWLSKGNAGNLEVVDSPEAVYLIALASDSGINGQSISFYKDVNLSENIYNKEINSLLTSKSYQLGHFLLGPVRLLRSFFYFKKK
jgi:SAM-dependent methyltransferase